MLLYVFPYRSGLQPSLVVMCACFLVSLQGSQKTITPAYRKTSRRQNIIQNSSLSVVKNPCGIGVTHQPFFTPSDDILNSKQELHQQSGRLYMIGGVLPFRQQWGLALYPPHILVSLVCTGLRIVLSSRQFCTCELFTTAGSYFVSVFCLSVVAHAG